ncbi:hypothetical protein I553_8713 [Mycobacterium xenopi 4042]|uniref:Uncharacterized protein n=1 Tax=Mycobacterium xenopi 4042 TaxID=1299334 RepID=X8CLE4_MYCXE|nr:hypothetical protein I553_8713 [Mycobacterium xenopi 4042]
MDVTRGVVGLGLHTAQAGAANLRRRHREGRLARDLAAAQESIGRELAAAQQVVSGLPTAVQQARRSQRRSRRPGLSRESPRRRGWPWGGGVLGDSPPLVALGAVASSAERRCATPAVIGR